MEHQRDGDLPQILSNPDASHLSSENLSKMKHVTPRKFLVNISIVDSAGPLKFVVDYNSTVEQVVKKALEDYELEGRLPPLGTDPKPFELYSAHDIEQALDNKMHIGDVGVRDFIVHKRANFVPNQDGKEDHPTSWRTMLRNAVTVHFNHSNDRDSA